MAFTKEKHNTSKENKENDQNNNKASKKGIEN
jgi:hypothetical protein